MLFAVLALLASGCGQDNKGDAKSSGQEGRSVENGNHGTEGHDKGDYSRWWCDEHGLPEEVCDLCHPEFREAEKARGNWCEHDRVKASCFISTPAQG